MVSPPLVHPSCPVRVLEAALEVFGEAGYRGSIDAVAKRAGVARQTIYNNFENKEALFLAAFGQAVRELFSALKTCEGDWYARLVEFSLRFRQRALSPELINLHRVLVSEAPHFPELADAFYQQVILLSRNELASVLAIGIQKGCLRDENPQEMADCYMNFLLGRDHQALLFGAMKLDPTLEEEKVNRAIELFTRAFAIPDSCSTLRKDAQ